jgi:hypothetical protein
MGHLHYLAHARDMPGDVCNMQRDEEEDLASDGLIAEEANTELDAIFRAIRLYGGSSHMMLSNKVPVATL